LARERLEHCAPPLCPECEIAHQRRQHRADCLISPLVQAISANESHGRTLSNAAHRDGEPSLCSCQLFNK
jgi:hypothetical protein